MPNQQSSLRTTRTAWMFHALIAVASPWSAGPSKMGPPEVHWYSALERLTPINCTGEPLPLRIRLPTMCRPDIGPPLTGRAVGVGVDVEAGTAVGVRVGVDVAAGGTGVFVAVAAGRGGLVGVAVGVDVAARGAMVGVLVGAGTVVGLG